MILLMLVLQATASVFYAQGQTRETLHPDPTGPFDIPAEAILDEFTISLDRKNSLHIELSNLADLRTLIPADSIINEFRINMRRFRDSLSDPLTIKKIDYLTDAVGRKLIRIQQHPPVGDNYLLDHGETSALKIDQDTINIVRIISGSSVSGSKDEDGKRFIGLTFYLNDFNELYSYDGDVLDSVITRIYSAARKQSHWTPKNNHNMKLRASYSLEEAQADRPLKVYPRYRGNDYLSPYVQGNMQNVYHYLSPSLNLGAKFVFPGKELTSELSFSWEPMFLFSKNDQGVMQTYRNDWLTAEYSLYKTGIGNKAFPFTGNVSLSYLIRNKGGFFDQCTFRLGLGGMKYNKITLEPVIYFHDLFKSVTPGIRFGLSF